VGHRLEAEVHLTLPSDRTVSEAHALGVSVQHRIMHALPYVAHVTVHADPEGAAGLAAHRLGPHEHDGLPAHGH
jgi:divalent metal cation (Fe/Co/Zn/Cd) transporter